MKPNKNCFYLAFEKDIIRLIYVENVKKIDFEDREYKVDATLIAAFTDRNEIYWYNKKMDLDYTDLEDLEKCNFRSLELITKKNLKNYMKYFFGDW